MGTSSETERPRRLAMVVAAVLAIAAIYLLPLAVVFLDEAVFHTFFVSRTLPDWVGGVFHAVYPFFGK